MENNTVPMMGGSTLDWTGLIGLLVIAGIFGNGGWGFGGSGNAYGFANAMTNEFVYTNLANGIRENNTAINTTDRDVLQNRYDNALQTNVLQNQASVNALEMQSKLDSCCCTLRSEMSANTQKVIDTITSNRIAELEKELSQAQTIIANTAQSQNILNSLGNFYPKVGVNPYAVYGYGYYNGTTIQ